MNDKTLTLTALGVAIAGLILASWAVVKVEKTATTIAVVDAKAVMEAKKLVLLSSLRGRDRDMAHLEKTIAASQKLPVAMDEALTTLTQKYGVTLIDKGALVKGTGVMDLTDELYRLMGVSIEEATAAKQAISRTTFGK